MVPGVGQGSVLTATVAVFAAVSMSVSIVQPVIVGTFNSVPRAPAQMIQNLTITIYKDKNYLGVFCA